MTINTVITAPARHYRPAVAGDAEAVVSLVNSAYRGDSSRQGWTTEADLLDGLRTDVDEVRELIARPDSLILLCLDGDRLIGTLHLERVGTAAELGMFTVRPGLQGRGLGREFLAEGERQARRRWAVTAAHMSVISRRHELIAWYERRGYRRTGRFREFPRHHPRYGIPKVDDLVLEVLEKRFDD
jgi:ribosomal protein S18 acetylase RimI-like enzyme